MKQRASHRPIDFELMGPEDQAKVIMLRQAIVDSVFKKYIVYEVPEINDRARRTVGVWLATLIEGEIINDPVELLRLTGMSEEEIEATGVIEQES